MFKKLLFIVSLLYSALFHSSAEVYYLKLNGKKVDGSFQISEGVSSEIFKSATLSNFNSSDDKAIYYDSDGKIVVYLPTVTGSNYDRVEEAQKQFENILNSGLIKNGDFDLTYVDVPARWKNGDEISKNRQMPGIAVRIDNTIQTKDGENIEKFPVLCATKSGGKVDDEESGATKFLTEASWESFFDEEVKKEQRFYDKRHTHQNVSNVEFLDDGEHTERQLFYSLIHNIVSNDDRKISLQRNAASTVSNSTFFVWTKGNPCITDTNFYHDNGGGCCSVWYKNTLLPKLRNVSSQVFIYFDNVFSNSEIWLNASNGHKTLVEVLSGKSITATNEDYFIPCKYVKDRQVLGVRITGETVPAEFDTLFVKVCGVGDADTMKMHLNLDDGKIPYVVDTGYRLPSSYSFTTAERQTVIDLLNRWMNGEGGQLTIQFVDHYKS